MQAIRAAILYRRLLLRMMKREKLPKVSWAEQRFSYEGKDFHKRDFARFIVNLLTKRALCESHCEKFGKSHNKTRNS